MTTCPNPIDTFVGDDEFRAAFAEPLARWLPGGEVILVAVAAWRRSDDGYLVAAELREATAAAAQIGSYTIDPLSGRPTPVSGPVNGRA